MTQWYCAAGGKRYGPIDESLLRQWIEQRRLGPTDMVWREGMGQWQAANATPELSTAFAPTGQVGSQPLAAPPVAGVSQAQPGLKPHRGGTILALGILGLVICFICGIFAWVMGSGDLREMQAQRMDPTGKSNTQAGKILGMVSVILAIAGCGFWVLYMVIALAAGGLH